MSIQYIIHERDKKKLYKYAKKIGVHLIGTSKVKSLKQDIEHLQKWIKKGFHGEMLYLTRYISQRENPKVGGILEDAESVISLGISYNVGLDPSPISRYARMEDYHLVVRNKLKELKKFLLNFYPQAKVRIFVDRGPVLEKAWARLAGLGWIGKNTLLITKNYGSWVFLGELITNIPLPPDQPIPELCGSCQRCMEACPTSALIKPKTLDATKCISYLTIEAKTISLAHKTKFIKNHIFGCEVCQEVCPWNQKAQIVSGWKYLKQNFKLNQLIKMNEEQFHKYFKHTLLEKIGFAKFRKNLSLTKINY